MTENVVKEVVNFKIQKKFQSSWNDVVTGWTKIAADKIFFFFVEMPNFYHNYFLL